MNGKERRNKIVRMLSDSEVPISGKELAGILDVSRQVIVPCCVPRIIRSFLLIRATFFQEKRKPAVCLRSFTVTARLRKS